MDFSVTAVTVQVVEFDTLPDEAEMLVVCPAVTVVSRPAELMVAAEVFDEAHVTDAVMSLVLLSVYVPFAWNCIVAPGSADEFAGVTAMDFSAAAVTARVVEFEMLPD